MPSGIKVRGEGEWHARKHGGARRRVWRKVHLGIDEATMEVRAVEITDSHVGDAPVLPDLIGQIPADEEIGSITADGAYDTRGCHNGVAWEFLQDCTLRTFDLGSAFGDGGQFSIDGRSAQSDLPGGLGG